MTTPPRISSNDPPWIRHQGLVKSDSSMGVPSCEVHRWTAVPALPPSVAARCSGSAPLLRRAGLVRRGGTEALVHPGQPSCAFLRNLGAT